MKQLFILLSLFWGSCVFAGDEVVAGKAADAGDATHAALIGHIERSLPGLSVVSVFELPVADLLEVEIAGQGRFYVTRDGKHLLTGNLLALHGDGYSDITEERMTAFRAAQLPRLEAGDLVTYTATPQRAEVFVFTDTTCGYCRRLHQSMQAINKLGITVHYLAFPRGGVQHESARLMRGVWCASNRIQAMDRTKLHDETFPVPESCDDPVAQQYELGTRFGVRGTPAVYDAAGRSLGGYMTPEQLAVRLGLTAPVTQ